MKWTSLTLCLLLAGCTSPTPRTTPLPGVGSSGAAVKRTFPLPPPLPVRAVKANLLPRAAVALPTRIPCGTNLCICKWSIQTNGTTRQFRIDVCNVPCNQMVLFFWADNPMDLINIPTFTNSPSLAPLAAPVRVGKVWMQKAAVTKNLAGECSAAGWWDMIFAKQFFRVGTMPM